MSFDTLGPGGLDYLPCRYGNSKILFRGPKRNLDAPYIAFMGDTHTYGKFVRRPFSDLVEDALGANCVNFGCMNAGVDVYAGDPFLREAATKARVTVLQILSPRNMSNRFYSVHPRRNDRFVKPSTLLESIYREVDFSEFNFTKHMLRRLHTVSPRRFETVVEELQSAWCARMRFLMGQIPGKIVLLWCSDHAPDTIDEAFGYDPWFISRAMIDELCPSVTAYVESVVSKDAMAAGTEGKVFSEMEAPAAEHVMGPKAHEEVAAALLPVLEDLIK